MFSISATGQFGEIEVDDFSERFAIHGDLSSVEFQEIWVTQLHALLENGNAVVLPFWSSSDLVSRGWVFYKTGDRIHIQDRLFPNGYRLGDEIPERQIITEEGLRVSEWKTSQSDISEYLQSASQQKTE